MGACRHACSAPKNLAGQGITIMEHAFGEDVVEVPSGYSSTCRKCAMPGMQLRRSVISFRALGSLTRVSSSRLSHTPFTTTAGSRSRSTARMFLANWRMKRIRTGRLLMVISGKTFTISFMKTARERPAEKGGADYSGNCSRFNQFMCRWFCMHQNRSLSIDDATLQCVIV